MNWRGTTIERNRKETEKEQPQGWRKASNGVALEAK
jgi:hypothetical protein